MNLLEQAQDDMLRILTDPNGVSTAITFTPPTGDPVVINSLAVKHSLSFDEYGKPVSSKQAQISVPEKALTNAGYTVRNNQNEVYLKGHLVTWTDAANLSWTYKVTANMPDEMLGVIVLTLEDYDS